MIFQIKRFRNTHDGRVEDGEVALNQEHIGIGASNEQDIIIEWPGVRLRHATITEQDDQLTLRASTKAGVSCNGKTVTETALKNGDTIVVGNHRIQIVIDNDQLTLEVTADETASAPAQPRYQTRLAHTGFSKRRWSWALLILIGTSFFAAPYASRYVEHLPAEANQYLPTDTLWNTGSFHPAHQFFAEDCSQCHQTPFMQVKNSACMDCHENVATHAPAADFPQQEIQQAPCLSCHKEHNGNNELITSDKQLCLDCHSEIETFTNGTTEQQPVHDWMKTHPDITFRMAQWDAVAEDWQWTQENAANPGPEQSGLLFPHDIHLRAEGFSDDNGVTTVLGCGDCHEPEPGGKLMQPINMEQHCESCHRLDFDAEQPDLFVRHGDIPATLRDIAGLKGLDQLKPDLEKQKRAKAPQSGLKRPGKSREYKRQEMTLVQLADELIEKRGCVTCHSVSRDSNAIEKGDLVNGWKVEPVHINTQWIDLAEFDHSGHSSMDCLSCHTEAEHSEKASDVLIPARDNCTTCHGNPGQSDLTDSQCIDCHSYHLPQHGWLSPQENAEQGAP